MTMDVRSAICNSLHHFLTRCTLTTSSHCQKTQSTAQHSTVQYRTGHHSTAQHSTVQYSKVQHSTGQDSTAQQSTAQHSTVQHSTVQYSTVQHSTRTAQHSTRTGLLKLHTVSVLDRNTIMQITAFQKVQKGGQTPANSCI
jgi:hypothetical protein